MMADYIRAYEINQSTGDFISDIPSHPVNKIGPGWPQYVTTPPPGGLISPRWDGAAWVEGADTPTQLAAIKEIRKRQVRAEGLQRIKLVYPALVDFDAVIMVRDILLSIAPAARQTAPDLQTVQSIWQAGKDAISAIDAISDLATAIAYDPVNDPSWP